MSESREAARERARELRDQHRKTERRRRLIVLGAVGGGVLVLVGVIWIVLASFATSGGRGPLNMQSDGIRIGAGFEAVRTPGIAEGREPRPSASNPPQVADIQIYLDYLCPNCGLFEERNGDQIAAWVESGAATVEYHPIALLTSKSAGTQYSMRAANAAACVAEYAPDDFFDFNAALFADQPEQGSPGLSDEEILDRAASADVANLSRIRECVEEKRFRAWVLAATQRALEGPIPGSDLEAITTTPTILVNGQRFEYTTAFDPDEFAQFVNQTLGQSFDETATPTPTPTPAG